MKGQITLFVIIAILIVAGVGLTLYLTRPVEVPSKFVPVENQVSECVTNAANDGAAILGSQGGYIELPEFEAGTEYIPFDSQFNFFGSIMPYWMYKSGNGIYKEQVPNLVSMSKQLGDYVNENLNGCDFSALLEKNYDIKISNETTTRAAISDNEILIEVSWPITATFQNTTHRLSKHTVTVKNNLGRKYNLAKKIYDEEKNKLFLEDYAIDVLALYAPGTDVVLQCSPKIWSKQQVINEIKNALKINLQTIKFSGNYYDLRTEENKYFVHDIGEKIDNQVNVLYDTNFPMEIEIYPSDGDIMRADPVGNQEGLGVLGFCYVPYHFVYSMTFPVIIQVFDENYEMFQFPMTVEIKNNLPRNEAIEEQPPEISAEMCQYKVQEVDLQVIGGKGEPVDAQISFKCHNTVCDIGETENGELKALFPQCVNGFIIAEAEGFAKTKLEVSTNDYVSAEMIMNNKYELGIEPLADSSSLESDESALIVFSGSDYSTSIYYPQQNTITLLAGTYNVTAYLFKEKSITLESQKTQKCIKIPADGLLGMMGLMKDECFDIETPQQEISQVTIGGGTKTISFSDEELGASKKVDVSIPSQKVPETMTDLQNIYAVIASSEIDLLLK